MVQVSEIYENNFTRWINTFYREEWEINSRLGLDQRVLPVLDTNIQSLFFQHVPTFMPFRPYKFKYRTLKPNLKTRTNQTFEQFALKLSCCQVREGLVEEDVRPSRVRPSRLRRGHIRGAQGAWTSLLYGVPAASDPGKAWPARKARWWRRLMTPLGRSVLCGRTSRPIPVEVSTLDMLEEIHSPF